MISLMGRDGNHLHLHPVNRNLFSYDCEENVCSQDREENIFIQDDGEESRQYRT